MKICCFSLFNVEKQKIFGLSLALEVVLFILYSFLTFYLQKIKMITQP